MKVEHAAEVWWPGGPSACWKLESAQMRVGRRLLGESNIVTGVAVQGGTSLLDARIKFNSCTKEIGVLFEQIKFV